MSCELGFENFDDSRSGRAAARSATSELRQLARDDWRVAALRCQRRQHSTAVKLQLRAASSSEALELTVVLLRTAVHASGGATTGWDDLHRAVAAAAQVTHHGRDVTPLMSRYRRPETWDEHAAAASRLAPAPDLPPLALASGVPAIDLR